MKPLDQLDAAGVRIVFTDIDDTLSTHGKITGEAYAALQALQEAGFSVVPVTGRPAGWCDHIARMWPVDAVIGENGAFYMWHDAAAGKLVTRHLLDAAQREHNQTRMQAVRQRVLRDAGIALVPVTGRPAGWCDHIARMWPVDAVIGENGAFYMWLDHEAGKLRTRHLLDEATRAQNQARLQAVRERVLREVPGAGIASDQFCRLYDLAIDFCEDVPPLPRESIDRIVALMEEAGMTAKVSSIHVNGWFGDYDKLGMARIYLQERLGLSLDDEAVRQACVFAGDSPNDAPMFGFFPKSVGVANVREFEDRLKHAPKYITPSACGKGFAELVGHLLGPQLQCNASR